MKMNYRNLFRYGFVLTICLLAACSSDDDAFDKSPSQRSSESIAALKNELVSASHGWRVLYFPKTDSLLFSNPSELISQNGFRGRYGYGGDCFTMKFNADNTVEMRADFTDQTTTEAQKSEYLVSRNSYTQLSFITYNYLHRLVNDRFAGASDFLYMGKNEDGDLVFRTAAYLQPAREYIVFTKLKSAEETTATVRKAYENRDFFEQMINPQLLIHRGGRTYFRSDIYVKRNVETNQALLKEIKEKRYYLFLFTQKKNPIPDYPAKEMTGLGSGYSGTEQGITFRAGLRYDSNMISFDFQREGNRFVAELVSVYDPLLRHTRLVSKHLHPEGEPTGLKAEIYDAPVE